ncbi:amyloid-beta A4 precursor protein-binding family B member 3 isoform X1 [Syngnathoides biaculeatus]|uniref:amyloid-beta A4 precursor protein-binding family B member 3 isoform X1 n=1 Tax=Syngnathoides biaculeatus TaxID=300417 RepID=UPI002ADDEEC6|nr:amyloid-beta A4 precursor protein-binding family B member 3 isoform X1 [Syngnathoides biaculeatus]
MMGKDYMLAIIIVNCDDNIWTDQNLLLDPDLPSGWRTIQDSTGTYYWHVPTGATQWQHPRLNGTPTQPHPDAQDDQKPPSVFEVPTDTRSWTAADSCRRDDNSQCFTVRSLGWLQVEEEDLSPGRSSLVVGNVIQQLSRSGDGGGDGGGGPPEQRNGPGLLTEGREMKLLLKQDTLTLVDPVDHTPLYCQPIINIRVWGVGSNNGRDFAFVAADKDSCVLKCHVFRCDAPAKAIATALHRMCSQMMSQQTSRSLSMDSISPEDLPRQVEFLKAGLQRIYKFDVYYVGNLPVSRAMGMEVLNLAIESIMNSTQRHEWEATVIHVTDNFLSVFKVDLFVLFCKRSSRKARSRCGRVRCVSSVSWAWGTTAAPSPSSWTAAGSVSNVTSSGASRTPASCRKPSRRRAWFSIRSVWWPRRRRPGAGSSTAPRPRSNAPTPWTAPLSTATAACCHGSLPPRNGERTKWRSSGWTP